PRVEKRIEAMGMPEVQERLGLAVAALLADVGLDGVAAEVPHHRRRAEADAMPALLNPPAQIHVVARGPEYRIEDVDLLEHLAPERQVTPRDRSRRPVAH